MSTKRALKEDEIIACTGARVASEGNGQSGTYEVQYEGSWIEVDYDSYERVRQIQDSCA